MDFPHLLVELRKRFDVSLYKDLGTEKRPRIRGAKQDPFWVDAFHQVYLEKESSYRDDLIFIVKWDNKESCEQVEVFRRDGTSLPSARDDSVMWEESLYLNFILHEFEYHVTCGVVTVNAGIVNSVTRRTEQQVYPSPSQRRMDKKESSSDVVYPNVMFCVDNFEEAFSDLYSTATGEKVAVQLIAVNKIASVKQLVFLGAIDHSALKEVYEARNRENINIASKIKKLSLKPRSSHVFDLSMPYHFVRLRGPHLKGFAEVAVQKQDVSLEPYLPILTKTSGSDHFFGHSEISTSGVSSSVHDTSPTRKNGVLEQVDGTSMASNEGGFSKLKSFLWKKPQSEKRYTGPTPSRVYAFLTYIQLPWYTLVDDILNCTKDMAL